ncbi:MAG: tryptophan--tRNA ligase [Candidatus Dependentiae bacterium]|jgi:tryptophanyl-tRNA synthetase
MRICSGIQPSGKLHLGNYFGALHNWLKLQAKGDECYFFIADLHAHTQPIKGETLSTYTLELMATLLAVGLDPEKVTLFAQSAVPGHTQLAWILSCLAPFGEMERMIQFKEKSANNPNAVNVGLFAYPILQAADILLYQADIVPVGVDQAQHLELTRTLARKFNNQFCPEDQPLFVEPRTLHTPTPKIIGLDGQRKMSKTYNNYIALTDSKEDLKQKLRLAATDPARIKRTDPGNPDVCNIFSMHKMFSDVETQKWANKGCRSAEIGCVQCKGSVFDSINTFIGPIREKYHELMKRPDDLHDALAHGAKKAQAQAGQVMAKVSELVGIR